MKGTTVIRKLQPYAALILTILALAFLVASVFTIGRTEIATTLGLAATGLAFLVIEWSVSS